MSTSKHSLSEGQLAILELLYKYRFGSRQLIGNSLGLKAGSSLHERMEVLVKHGYIDKRYQAEWRLQGIPIAYYLLPKAVRTLQSLPAHDFVTNQIVNNSYRDKTVGLDFVVETLKIYQCSQ